MGGSLSVGVGVESKLRRPTESGSLVVALCPGQWAAGWCMY